MKWIAVDYGERRTGLAVCDASELIVTPVTPQIEEKSQSYSFLNSTQQDPSRFLEERE